MKKWIVLFSVALFLSGCAARDNVPPSPTPPSAVSASDPLKQENLTPLQKQLDQMKALGVK